MVKIIGQHLVGLNSFLSKNNKEKFFLEPCLAIQLHSVDVYQTDHGLSLVKTFRTEDELIRDNEKRTTK
jgi:hypothetical protein